MERLLKFGDSLQNTDDRHVFADLVTQCRLYASAASSLASPVKEVPLIISMLFAQHKKILALEKWAAKQPPSEDSSEAR